MLRVRAERERNADLDRALREAQFSLRESESKLQDIFAQQAMAQRELTRIENDRAQCAVQVEAAPADVMEDSLQAALATDSPILPVGLAYLHGHGQARLGEARRHDAPTYIGDTTLIASIWRTLKAGNVRAELRYGPPQRAGGMDRRTWAQVLRRDIGAMLN